MTSPKLYRKKNPFFLTFLLSFVLTWLLSLEAFSKESSLEQSKKGLKAYREKNYASCIESLKPVSETLSSLGLLILSKCFHKEGQIKEVQKTLKLLFLKKPDYKPALYFQAQIYDLQGETKKAIENYNKIIKNHPKEKKAYDLLLKLFVKQKNYHETKELVFDMTKLFGQTPLLLKELCKAYVGIKQAFESLETCQKALKKLPKDEQLHIALAESYFLNNKEKERRSQYLLASQTFPQSEWIQRYVADFYFKEKNYLLSYKHYKSILSLKGYAVSSFELKKYEEALELFKKACKKFPVDISNEFLKAKSTVVAQNIVEWIRPYRVSLELCEASIKNEKRRKEKKKKRGLKK